MSIFQKMFGWFQKDKDEPNTEKQTITEMINAIEINLGNKREYGHYSCRLAIRIIREHLSSGEDIRFILDKYKLDSPESLLSLCNQMEARNNINKNQNYFYFLSLLLLIVHFAISNPKESYFGRACSAYQAAEFGNYYKWITVD